MIQYTQGIDLSYRPCSFFWAAEKGIALISDIKGAERRKLYQGALQSGLADQVNPDLLQHDLPNDHRQTAVTVALRQAVDQMHRLAGAV